MRDIALCLWYSVGKLPRVPVYFFAAYGASPTGPIKHIEARFFNGHTAIATFSYFPIKYCLPVTVISVCMPLFCPCCHSSFQNSLSVHIQRKGITDCAYHDIKTGPAVTV